MLALLMLFSYDDLQHVRAGQPAELNVLIRKAKGFTHLWPYITDTSGRTLWADPDCVRAAISHTINRARQTPNTPKARACAPEPAKAAHKARTRAARTLATNAVLDALVPVIV